MRREAERENNRSARNWRETRTDYETYKPQDDNGPGYLSKATESSLRSKFVTFKWTRESRSWDWRDRRKRINCTIRVEKKDLFNVDAYVPGDFKQFFADVRTRERYLQWAPMMLAAEEYYYKLKQKIALQSD